MKKSRWIDPYTQNANGRLIPSIRDCWTCAQAGVYLIRHKQTGTIVYVGSSTTQLKKTIYRHFEVWNDRQPGTNRRFERVTYPKKGYYEIRFFKCTPDQAHKIERYLIRKLEPKDNPLKYNRIKQDEHKAGEKLYKKALQSNVIPAADYLEPAPF
jgi:hypothetical protein